REAVGGARLPVAAEAHARHAPVVGAGGIGQLAGVAIEVLAEDAEVTRTSQLPTVAQRERGLLLVAATGLHIQPLGVAGMPGGDVDDAVDGVGAPLRGAGPADDL